MKLSLVTAILLLSTPSYAAPFAQGADVGWVDEEEAAGHSFYDRAGVKTDPFVLLKNMHVNAIRLRVWVNPGKGWNNPENVLAKAKRAAAQGQHIMIDFHYSDTWADWLKQPKPAAWTSHNISQLVNDVSQHTTSVLNLLKTNGIVVDWVQVGNEINGGILWPDGSTSNFANLVRLLNSGYHASKAVYPNAEVVIQLANGYKNAEFRVFFDNMKANGGLYDVIGMSHYPAVNWANMNAQISSNMVDMVSRYNKPVMICEVGLEWNEASAAKNMIADLLNHTRALGANGLGVFYWEPQAYPNWDSYNKGALDQSGKFTIALDAFN